MIATPCLYGPNAQTVCPCTKLPASSSVTRSSWPPAGNDTRSGAEIHPRPDARCGSPPREINRPVSSSHPRRTARNMLARLGAPGGLPKSRQGRWIGDSLLQEVAGIGLEPPIAVHQSRRPRDLDRLDPIGSAQAESGAAGRRPTGSCRLRSAGPPSCRPPAMTATFAPTASRFDWRPASRSDRNRPPLVRL